MSKLGMIVATALLSVGAFASVPSMAAEPVHGISGRDAAASECLSFNKFGPVQVVAAVEDGVGDYIVWVRDKDSDLWLCNASANGDIYLNTMIKGDLLKGAGKRAISIMPVAHTTGLSESADTARRLCVAAGRHVDATRVAAIIGDGVGDQIVWLQGSDHSYWLCNASEDAKLFVFERVRAPINAGAAGPSFRAT
jgi:hypothetical protein